MAFRHSVVLLMCLTFAAARTVNLERLVLSLTDDSKDTDPDLAEILTSFLANHHNTADGVEFDLRTCDKGSCKLCLKKIVDVCFVASIGSSSIHIEITLNGQTILHTDIKAPRTICKDVDFIPDVKQICIEFSDIDLQKMSGCVSVSVKTKLIPLHFKIGCFAIPHEELEGNQGTTEAVPQQDNTGSEEMSSEPETVLKFLSLRTDT